MEYIAEKTGISRTITNPSIAVTLLRVVNTKVCEVGGGKTLVAYLKGKISNKCVTGQQKEYNLSAEYNRFAALEATNTEAGDLDETLLNKAKILKVSFSTKGRSYSGAVKRHNFARSPASHGSRFHRRHESIDDRGRPGRVQPGMKMTGHYGDTKATVKNEVVSYDAENRVLVVRGVVPGYNGAVGKIRTVKRVR